MLFECLTGEGPFRRRSEVATLFAHLEEDPPSASARHSPLPAAIDPVLARALAKEPGERQSSCAELVADASAALGLDAVRPRRLRLAVATAAVVLVLAAAALAAILVTREGTAAAADRFADRDRSGERRHDRPLPRLDASRCDHDGRRSSLGGRLPRGCALDVGAEHGRAEARRLDWLAARSHGARRQDLRRLGHRGSLREGLHRHGRPLRRGHRTARAQARSVQLHRCRRRGCPLVDGTLR